MKVLLINPPSNFEIMGNNPSIIESERGYNPPLGLLYVAAEARRLTDHEISVIDAQVEELDYTDLARRIEAYSPDVVGVTAMTFTLIDVIKTLELVKKNKPETITVLGGPHVYIYPQESISIDSVDYLVLGEGERIFAQFLDALANNSDISEISSLVYINKNGEIVNNTVSDLIADLDSVSHPARDLVPYKKYSSILFSRKPVTTIFTSRGCPFRCKFCLRPHLGNNFRSRSPENILSELKECIEMGIKDFLFYDDTFTVIRKRVIKTCELILENNLDIRWDCRARIDTVDEEMLRLMKKAGCTGIHYGIEAGTEKVLKALKKEIDLQSAKKICDITHKIGIKTLNYFMIGSPTESKEDIFETIRMMKWLRADYVHITVFTPFPGTEIYNEGLASGLILKDYWREFAADPKEGFVPPHWPENFSIEELHDLLNIAYKKFYLRPAYMLKVLFSLRSFSELITKARAALKIVKMKIAKKQ